MIGETVGHYRITEKLGEGGMGVVYRATDLVLGRQVVLKLLRAEATPDPDRHARFLYEAKSASGLNHPNIVTIYEIGTAADSTYIAMEYVAGSPLQRLIPRRGLPTADVLHLAIQIADALSAAHAAGVVHRDLKPPNVMVTGQQRVKLVDFGLATEAFPLDGSDDSLTRSVYVRPPSTREGVIVGTVGYMSPEQIEGGQIDQRSDIFSFGCVLHEMITGDPAFAGETAMSTLIAVASRDPTPIASVRGDVPPALERLVSQCLHKKPSERPQRIADVHRALEELADSVRAPRWALIVPVPAWIRRRARAGVHAAALIALLAGIAGTLRWWRPRESGTLPTALTQLTWDSGLSTNPAVSPDGRLFAYASDREGASGLDIWVRPLAGGRPTRLTTHAMDDSDPAFSADGSLIAFRSERNGGGVFVVPSSGGLERPVAVNGRRPRFSPDGKWIVYWIGAPGGGTRDDRIFLAPSAGGPSREWLEGWGARSEPVWSPDAKHILFLGTRAGGEEFFENTDWWIAPVEGGPVVRTGVVKRLREPPFVYSPVPEMWLRGDSVVFSRPGVEGTSIWRARLNPSTGAMTEAPERLTSGAPIETRPSIGPDGRLVYARIAESVNIWALPLDPETGSPAGGLRRVTDGAFIDAAPFVTPDGSKMAFISNRLDHDEVWFHDVQTGRQVAITSGSAHKVFPILDRSASRLAYAQADSGKYAIYVIPPGGGVTRRICAECGLPRSWVPAANRILYQAGNPSGFWTVDASTGEKQIAATYEYGLYSPRFSFDENWLVFHARIHPDATRILIAPYRGAIAPPGDWIHITSGEFEDDKPRWAPADDKIYFLSRRDGFRCLWWQRLDPATKRPRGQPELLVHFHETRLGMMHARFNQFDLAVARDKLLLTLAERTGNIWVAAAGGAH